MKLFSVMMCCIGAVVATMPGSSDNDSALTKMLEFSGQSQSRMLKRGKSSKSSKKSKKSKKKAKKMKKKMKKMKKMFKKNKSKRRRSGFGGYSSAASLYTSMFAVTATAAAIMI